MTDPTIPAASLLFEESVPGGWNWSHVLKRGTSLRLTDTSGGACVPALFFNPRDLSEKYNMPDTLKCQFTGFISKGHALYSDMGRVLVSVIDDTAGRHDAISGVLTQKDLEARFGKRSYQEFRNGYFRSPEHALLTEMSKYGLGIRDLTAPLNLFCHIDVDSQGNVLFANPQSEAGSRIDLQAEMDTLVVIAPSQHKFDPQKDWSPRDILVQVWESGVPAKANPAWHHCDQNKRGFENTRRYVS